MTVSSERAERSTIRANRALAHFRTETAAAPMGSSRDTSAAGGTAVYRAHDAILRLVAIAEDFSIGRFVDAIEPLLPSGATVSKLWEAELDRSGDTWRKREGLWRSYKSIKVSKFPRNNELQAYIEARNAITHGLGRLTRRQLRGRAATLDKLRPANIVVRGDELVLGSSDVEACAEVVKAFIVWLDARC